MPLRFGEMVLIIRTQDFASRNLDRISASIGRLSKAEQLGRRRQQLGVSEAREIGRQGRLTQDLAAIRMMERQIELQNKLNSSVRTTSGLRTRGPGGRFLPGPTAAELRELASLNQLVGQMPSRLKRLSGATVELADRSSRLSHALNLSSRQLRIIQSDIAKVAEAEKLLKFERIHRMGQTISRLGRVLQLTGLIATASFVAMGNSAANFSASATLAATQARDFGAGTEQVLSRSVKLQEAIIEQMRKFPVSADEMSNAAYEIFSSLDLVNEKGLFNFNRGLQILQKANKAAVAGGVSLDDSIRGLIITLNNFDSDLNNVDDTLDTMFDIVRFGNIHFSDLTLILSKVAPAAKSVGHTLEDVAGALSQATRNLPAGTVAAGFSQLEATFANRDFQEGLRVLSKLRLGKTLDIAPEDQLRAPLEILQKIAKIFPELTKGELQTVRFFKLVTRVGRKSLTGQDIEGREFTIQQRRVFETMIQNLGTVEELQGAVGVNQKEMNRAFAAMLKDPGVQWKIFLSQLRAFSLELGKSVLPVLLDLAEFVQKGIDKFRSLSPETRELIVKAAALGSVFLLLGGITASLVGSIISLVGTLGILGKNLTPLMMLNRFFALAAGGLAINLVLNAAITGDMNAWTFIKGAMFGAAAGSIFGPGGAIVGGITVPVFLNIIKGTKKTPKETAFQEFQNQMSGIEGFLSRHGQVGIPGTGFKFDLPIKPEFNKEQFNQQWALLIREAKGKTIPPSAIAPIDPVIRGLFAKYKKDIISLKKPAENSAQSLRGIIKAAGDKTALEQFDKLLKSTGELDKMFGRTGDSAQGLAQAIAGGIEEGERRIEAGVENLKRIFTEFRDENTRAFGELFKGPFFQSETWSLAQEWDVKPTILDINKDLRMQIAEFKRYRSVLASLGKKKGVPPEMIKELRALGPEAMPYLEAINKAAPGQLNKFISMWKQKQREIEKATKIDFDNQLKQWNKFGSDIAQQIILGLRSQDVALDNAFKTYITDRFPNIIAQAKAEAIKEFKKQQAAGNTGDSKGKNTKGTTTNNTTNVTQNIHPAPSEKTKDVLRRARQEAERIRTHR